ncbi:hypothetical protein Tco_0360454 [Tanacetum coccineum]
MTAFNEFINNMRLIEIPMGGRKFTRVRDDGMKLSKLDRFLLNERFNDLWGNLSIVSLHRKLPEHCPIVLKDIELDFDPKPFRMELGEKWCKWVDTCLRSSSMSILVNGSPSEEFGLERGVRQGDSLSHFLFILAAKGLNAIVTEAVEKGIFKGVVVGANKVNYNKSKIYGIGANKEDMADMVRWMECGIEEIPFTYLWLPIRENMRRIHALGLAGSERLGLWVGECGGRVWNDIVWIGEEIDGTGLEFSLSYYGVLGEGRDIRFWVDRWVDNRRLCDRFPRLYHLDRRNERCVRDKGSWVNDVWYWEWVSSINGRVTREFEELLEVVQDIIDKSNCRDKWRWVLDEDDEFKLKELARLVDEKTCGKWKS